MVSARPRPAELSLDPLLAAADRPAARAGADRPGRRWLLKVKPSPFFFRRSSSRQLISWIRLHTRRSMVTLLDLLRGSPRASDPAALRRGVAVPPLAADRPAARVGADRPWRWWLQCSSSFLRRGSSRQLIGRMCPLARRSVETLLDLLRGSPCGVFDPAAVVVAFCGLGAAGTVVLHVLIASGIITTPQEYFGMISFCFRELRRVLVVARDAWDVCSSLLWLWEDMQERQPKEQQLQASAAAVQVISDPPPPELDIC